MNKSNLRNFVPLNALLAKWRTLSHVQQFLTATSFVVLCGMTFIANWIGNTIAEKVVHNTATATALYLDNFVEPHTRELATTGRLSANSERALEQLLLPNVLGNRIVAFNLWDMTGRAVFSTRPNIIGTVATGDEKLITAMSGEVTGAFIARGFEHIPQSGTFARPLVEIYAPIRGANGSVIAVAEFYENGDTLREEVLAAKKGSWLLVGSVALAMLLVQFHIVRLGGATIESQQLALDQRIRELTELLAQNEELKQRVEEARRKSHELNEQFMRRVGADLHDGPAQLISMSILMLEPGHADPEEDENIVDDPSESVALARDTLRSALDDIRLIALGLLLPELEDVSLERALTMAANAHMRRTKTSVKTEFINLTNAVTSLQKATIYRIAQEGLNNAFFHAGGSDQVLRAVRRACEIEVEVLDAGPGPTHEVGSATSSGLGLAGLKDRLASLGGSLELVARPEGGSRLHARIPI